MTNAVREFLASLVIGHSTIGVRSRRARFRSTIMATILVVDDSAVDRRFVGGILSRDGKYHVEFAEDGSQALANVRQSPPDVIVTDLQMPNRNGLELVAAVRLHH